MKNILGKLSTLLVTATLAFTSDIQADASVQFGVGYRTDEINWKLGLHDTGLAHSDSKLWFKDLEIFTIGGRIKSSFGDCVHYRIDGQYGWVLDGDVRESDHLSLATDTAGVFATIHPVTHNDVHHKYVADFAVAVGYPIQQCWFPSIQVSPLIGFGYDTQRLSSKNHNTILDNLPANVAAEFGIDATGKAKSSFRTTWWGPFIGLDLAFFHQDCWNLYGELEYHFVRLKRDRNSDTGVLSLDRHRRSKRGDGIVAKLGAVYHINCDWFIDGNLGYKTFVSHHGHDRVHWKSFTIMADLGRIF